MASNFVVCPNVLETYCSQGVDPDQTAPIEAVRPWSTLCDSVLELDNYVSKYLQQTTSIDVIFQIHCLSATMADSLSRALAGSEPFI